MAMSVDHIGIVYAMMALRPAGSCCKPKSTKPFHPAMLKNARTARRPHHPCGTLSESPLYFATSIMPSAANGSVTRER